MRELSVSAFLTLDGVMQAPGGPEEDPSGGFEHGGWSVGYWDGDMERAMGESMSKPFDLVLGRKTYEIFAAHWPHTDEPGADLFNGVTKHVASTTRSELEWANSRLIEGDVADGIRALKEQDGPELQVPWQRQPDPDAAHPRARRRVSPEDLPARARDGQASLRRRNGARRARADKLGGLVHRRGHGHLPQWRRDQVRLLRA